MINAITGIIDSVSSAPAEALAYRTRVLADGGTINDWDKTVALFNYLLTSGYWANVESVIHPALGVKINGTNGVLKMYGVTGVSTTGHIPDINSTGAASWAPTYQFSGGRHQVVFNGVANQLIGGNLTGFVGDADRTIGTRFKVGTKSTNVMNYMGTTNGGGSGFYHYYTATETQLGEYSTNVINSARVNNVFRDIRGVKKASTPPATTHTLTQYVNQVSTGSVTNPAGNVTVSSFRYGDTSAALSPEGIMENTYVISAALTTTQADALEIFLANL